MAVDGHPPRPSTDASAQTPGPLLQRRPGAWLMVAMLCLLYILSYIDRVILSLLAQPLREELGVNDIQLGLLFGSAFAFFYGAVGIPIARIADTKNRKLLILGGVLLWTLSTIASAFATSFEMLVILRIGLALGEAALSPAAYSLIADSFPTKSRAAPASIYAASGTFGAYSAYIVGAAVITLVGAPSVADALAHLNLSTWRLVFLFVGAPGLLLALIFAFAVREPPRQQETAQPQAKLSDIFKTLGARWRLYMGLVLGAGGVNVISFAYAGWTPELLRRDFGYTIADAGFQFGLVGLLAALPGTLGLTWIAGRLRAAGRRDALIIAAAAAALIGGIAATVAPLMLEPQLFLGCLFVAVMMLTGCTNLAFVSSQTLAPPGGRGLFVSLMLLGTTMVGLGVGPPLAAWLSQSVFTGDMRMSLSVLSAASAASAFALILAARRDAARLAA